VHSRGCHKKAEESGTRNKKVHHLPLASHNLR
jgi:hypothetical protein